MLGKLLSPFTTATSVGVGIRYLTTIATTMIAIVGILGWLTPEQVAALTQKVPELITAISAVVMAAIPLYAIITKSSSDKAAEAAKQIDAKLPPAEPVEIKTPGNAPNIVVPASRG